jgi:hypothetical protein
MERRPNYAPEPTSPSAQDTDHTATLVGVGLPVQIPSCRIDPKKHIVSARRWSCARMVQEEAAGAVRSCYSFPFANQDVHKVHAVVVHGYPDYLLAQYHYRLAQALAKKNLLASFLHRDQDTPARGCDPLRPPRVFSQHRDLYPRRSESTSAVHRHSDVQASKGRVKLLYSE